MAEKAILYVGTGIDAAQGFNFEYQATCLAYLRCVKLHKEFQRNRNSGVKSFAVANSVKEFCPIDDVVIKIECFEGDTTKTKLILVQCKHAADPGKNPSKLFQNLLDNDKMVQKYFDKFIDIHKKFESGNENELQPDQSKTNIHNFFCDVFKDCEFVFYSNVKPEITSTSKFELSTNVAQNNIAEKLLGTIIDVRCYRLKYSESIKLKCDPSDDHLKKLFCENFTVMINQDNLECYIAKEIKLILHSDQRIRDISKYFTKEIHYHFNVPDLRQILSEESGVVEAIQAYVTLKSQSEDKVDQFKRNSSFQNLFTEETVRRFEQRLSGTNLKEPICIPTKFMELEKRKIIQVFKLSDDVCLLIISSEVDERNWYLARETKTYNKWKKVKICADFLMRNLIALKPNEIFVQIVNTCEECDPIAYFETLSPETEQILLSSKVCFQGKLQELGQCSDGKWINLLDEDTICKMLEDKHVLNIGKPLAELDFYIDRKFKIRTINATKLPYINSSQNFKLLLFSERNNIIPSTGQTFVWFENMPEARNLLQKIPEKTENDIHLCSYNAENHPTNSELIYSFGGTSKLAEIAVVKESYLLKQMETSKIVILSDIAGMGKTTTLLSIARKFKEENPSHWVYFLELNKYLNELRNGKFPDKLTAVNFVARKILKLKSMDLKMFTDACIETGNVVLCFDAFDEISPDAEKTFPKLLKNLEETKIKSIIVSSRPNFARHLEQQFYQNSVEFVPFKSEDKVKFLLEKWRTMMENENKEINANETDMEGAINRILGEIWYESDSIEELLGIPLQMRMISEIYFDTLITLLERKVGAENLKINLYSLYDKFITLQTIRYCTEKEGTMWEKLTEEKQILHLYEKLYGVEIFCTDFVCPEIKLPNMLENTDLKLCNGIGLLSSLRPPVFIHRTYAIFLAAKYIVIQIVGDNNKQNQEILPFFYLSILVEAKYETLRTFINATFGQFDFKERNIHKPDITICRGTDGNTALHFAASEGNKEILKKLLVLNIYDINDRNSRQETPLLLACQKPKSSETAKYLISYPECQVDAEDHNGNTAMHVASERGHIDIIKILLERDLTLPNKQNKEGKTPIQIACEYDRTDTLKHLLEYQECSVGVADNDGKTALHHSAKNGNVDITEMLLERDHTLLNIKDEEGMTPLTYACKFNKAEVVKKLLSYSNCFRNEKDRTGMSALQYATKNNFTDISKLFNESEQNLSYNYSSENEIEKRERYFFHNATRNGDIFTIEFILKSDFTLLNNKDDEGKTPLHIACELDKTEIVQYFLKFANCAVNIVDEEEKSVLHYASENENIEIMKLLLKRDITLLNQQDIYGETPLYIACKYGKTRAADLLLTRDGCLVDKAVGENEKLPFHCASQIGNIDIMKLLLKHDKNKTLLNQQDKNGDTALHLACAIGNIEVVKFILTLEGLTLDIKDKWGNTCLHVAALSKCCNIMSELYKKEPGLLIMRNKKERTALHMAANIRNDNVIKFLTSKDKNQVNNTDKNGDTPLHLYVTAYKQIYFNVCKANIKLFIDVDPELFNKTNDAGETPLHKAVLVADHESVKQLIKFGAEVNIKDNNGNTPLSIANKMSEFEERNIEKYLADSTSVSYINNDKF